MMLSIFHLPTSLVLRRALLVMTIGAFLLKREIGEVKYSERVINSTKAFTSIIIYYIEPSTLRESGSKDSRSNLMKRFLYYILKT